VDGEEGRAVNLGRRAPRLPYQTDLLKSLCWCMKTTVGVTKQQVRSGLTESCEDPCCTPALVHQVS
jgi:hypothetical protein